MPQRIRRASKEQLAPAIESFEYRVMLSAQTFSVSGPASVTEDPTDGDNNLATYTISYTGALGTGESASVDVSHVLNQTNSADYTSTAYDAIATAVAGTSGTSFDSNTGRLTFNNTSGTTTGTTSGYPTVATDAADGDYGWDNLAFATGNNSSNAASQTGVHHYDVANTIRLKGFGLNVPTNATITGIQVVLTTTGSSNSAGAVKLTKNGTSAVGTPPAASGTWSSGLVTHGGSTSMWGTTWTPADLNSSNFGLLIQPDPSGGSSNNFYIYNAYVEVTYTTSTNVSPTSLTFSLPIANDSEHEGTENFSLTISNPLSTSAGGADIATATASTDIGDDDVTFTISGASTVTETTSDGDNNQATYTVTYSGTLPAGSTASVTVNRDWNQTSSGDFTNSLKSAIEAAIAAGAPGVSYNRSTGVLTFSGGSGNTHSLTFTLDLADDAVVENSEQYSISLSNPSATSPHSAVLGTSSVTTTVTSDDVAAPQVVSIAGPATVGENPADPNGNSAEYTINYNGTLGLGDSVSVDVTHLFGDTDGADFSSTVANALATAAASTPGVSYNAGTGTLTFSNGTANVLRTLVGYPTTATQASDGDEAWTNLFDAIGNTPSTATDVKITHNYYTSNTLRLTGYELDIPTNATINGIKVALTTTGSTATSAASVLLTKNGTTAVGSGASSTGSWSSGSVVYGGSTSQWGTTWTPAELNSGNFGVLISIDDDGHFYLYNAQIEVSYTTVDSVSPTSVTFSVPITNDASLEGDEDFSISLGNVSATGSEGAGLGTSSVTTTIADDDIVFSISGNAQVTEITTDGDNNLATYTVGFEGVLASGKSASVKLTHNLGETVSADFVNTLNSAIAAAITAGATGVSYNSSTQVLTFSGGAGNATSLTFSLEIENDSLIEADETFSVSLSEATASSPYSASLGTSSANTTISNDDLFIFAVTGGGSVTEDSSDGDGNQVTYMVNYTGDLSSGQSVSVEVHHDLGDTAVGDYASTFASAIATAVGNTPGTSYDSLTHKLTFSHTVATVSESSVGYPSTASEASNGDASWANLANVTGDTPSTAATVDNGNHDIANTLRLTGYGLDVPSDATVTGIKLILTTTGSSTPDIVTVLLTKNGTTSVGSAASSTGSWASGSVSYGSMTSMWGTTWTPAELNSGNFGALISLEEEGSFAIYNARIEVSYTRVANITPTSLTFTLPVLDDIAAEATEEFAVTLSNPTVVGQIGAAIGTDSAGASIIDDDNTPSTDVILLNNSIDENSPIGTQFGLLTTEDADVGNTFVYTLVSGTGDDDNGLFSIVGDQIQLNTSLDFETKSEYSIRVRSTDQQAGYSIERTITIQVANVNPSVFYVKDDGVHGSELWKSDGSATGSVMVADVNPGSESSNPENIFVIGDTVYFTANDGVHGRELWKSDGTETGTVMVADINPGSGSSDAGQFTNWNDILYFVAGDGGNGLELWKSDGTQTGTTLVADINSGTAGSNPQRLTVSGSWLYMVANDGTHGRELWKSDGTSGGTSLVADLTSGTADSNPQELADVNGTLFFTHEDTTYGRELWKSDAGGTSLVLDARPGSASSTPLELTNVGGTLFMSLDDGVHGRELWKSDGTAGGTQLVSDVRPGSGSSLPEEFIDVNGEVYFTAFNDTTGAEIWKSGGTAATTSVVTDVSEVAYTGGPQRLRLVDEAVYFQLQTGSAAITLWRTDRTVSGTEMVTDTPANPDGSDSDSLLSVNGTLYFAPAESPLPAQSSQALNHAPVIIAMAQPPVWATFDRKAAGNEDGFEMLLKEFLELERIPYSQGAPTDFVTDLYDNSPQEGIAVFFATSTGGVWEYAIASTPPTDPNSWTPINGHNNATPVTQSSALLLKSDDQTWIRFNPSKKPNGATSTFTGDASLWFNAWDLTDGRSPGDRVSTLPTEKGVNKSISAQHTESIMYVTDSNAATPYIAPPIPTNLALTSITKNNYNSTGTAIYELLNPLNSVLPQDTYDKFGIAVTNVNTEFGTWQYTLNNGWIWSDLGPVSPTSAVLLMRNSRTRLRFIPNTDYAGEIENALTFKIWNPFVAIPGDENNPGTDFTAMNGFREINTTIAYGGKTPFSVDSVNAKITVTSDSNVPPVLNPNVSAPSWGLVLPNAVSEDFSIKFFLENQVDAQGNPLLAPLISDADTTDENLGVAVYSPVPIDDTAGGHWEYSTDNKNFWRVLNYESIIAARLLRATDTYFIRYRPSNEFSGTAPIPTLQVKAWDQTQGIIAGVGDVQSWTGDHAPFSLTTLASSFTYNIAPVIAVDSATTLDQINENQTDNPGTLVSDLISAARLGANAITDDLGLGGNELGIAITTADSTNGTWQFTTDGTTWDGLGNVSDVTARLLAADSTTRVRFVPNAGYHGDIPTGLTFRAWDQMRAGARFNGKNGDLADTSDTVLISGATFRNNGGATPFSEVKATASIKVNANPTDIALSNDTIAENSAVGTVIGFFSVMDSDGDAPYTYSLVTGTGDTDNALFTIEFDNSIGQSGEFVLKNAAIFNYESLSSPHTYSIRVRSTDAGGAFFEETFTISVLDIPEPPTFTGSATLPVISSSISSVDNVGLPVSDLLGQINASDPESSPLFLTGFVDGSSSGTWQKKAPTDTDWSTWELTDLVSSDSSIRFVPLDANSTGTASATFRLQNSNGEQSATDVAVSVDVTTITFGITGPDALTENPNDEPGIFEIHYLGPTLEAGQSASIKVTSNSPEVMSAISTRNLPGVTFDDLTSILKFQPLTSDVSQVPLTHQPNSISLESIPPQTVYTEWTFSANTTLPATVTRGTGFSLSIRPLRFSAFNLDLPADAIVDGIQVRLTTAASPSTNSVTAKLIKGGESSQLSSTVASTGTWSGGTMTFGGSNDKWGTTWTAAELNDQDFALFLSLDGAKGVTYSLNDVEVIVSYSLSQITTPAPSTFDFTVNPENDGDVEPPSTFDIELSYPTAVNITSPTFGISPDHASFTIIDNDVDFFILTGTDAGIVTAPSSTVEEGMNDKIYYRIGYTGTLDIGATVDVDVSFDAQNTSARDISSVLNATFQDAIDAAINAAIQEANLSGDSGITYLNGTLTFTGGADKASELVFSLDVIDDFYVEDNETFTLSISVPGTGTNSGTGGVSQGQGVVTTTIVSYDDNLSPVLDPSGSPAFLTYDEDDVTNVGTTIAELIASMAPGGMSDQNEDSPLGIAVIDADTSNGYWQYSIDNGANWSLLSDDLNPVLPTEARLLAGDNQTRIRFVPELNFNGTISAAITFRAWDQFSGSNGGTADTTTNGDPTPFSELTETASITISAVDDAPTAVDDSATMDEDGAPISIDVLANDSDVEGQPISIVQDSAGYDNGSGFQIGTTQYGGSVTINGNGTISYTPAANFWGIDTFVYTITDGALQQTATVVITVNAVNDGGPVANDDSATTSEDTEIDIDVLGNDTDVDNDPLTFVAGSIGYFDGTTWHDGMTQYGGSVSVNPDKTIAYTPPADFYGTDVFSYMISDGFLPSNSANVTVTVNATNDAPVLNVSGSPALTNQNEGDTSHAGTTIESLIAGLGGSGITDVDASALEGIAVIATDTTYGSWEYSLDGGSNWDPVGSVTEDTALLLAADTQTRIRFVPGSMHLDFEGTISAAITFRAWDQTTGANGGTADATTNGGTTAFSIDSETASITITAVNDAPELDNSGSPALTTYDEDDTSNAGTTIESLIAGLGGDGITDVDAAALQGIAVIDADTSNGHWEYSINNGSDWLLLVNYQSSIPSTNARLLASDGQTRIRFVPNQNYEDTISAAITFRAWDQTMGTNGDTADATINGGTTAFSLNSETASLTITAVNDAPVITVTSLNSLDENEVVDHVVGTLQVSDVDTPIGQVTLASIVDPAGIFSIELQTGSTDTYDIKVQDNTLLDHEYLTWQGLLDVNGDYTLVVSFTDGTETTSENIKIHINDVAEAGVFSLWYLDGEGNPVQIQVSGNFDFGSLSTQTGGTLDRTFTIVNLGDTSITFDDVSLGTPSGSLSLTPDVLTIPTEPAASTSIGSPQTFTLQLDLSLPGDITQPVTISYDSSSFTFNATAILSDYLPPEFSFDSTTEFKIPEDAPVDSYAMAVDIQDSDEIGISDPNGDPLSINIIEGNQGNTFELERQANGKFKLKVANNTLLDGRTIPTFTLLISVSDSTGLSVSQLINVHVTTVNDPLTVENFTGSLSYLTPTGSIIGYLSAYDPDPYTKITFAPALYYPVDTGIEVNGFGISPFTGALYISDASQLIPSSTPYVFETFAYSSFYDGQSPQASPSESQKIIVTLTITQDVEPSLIVISGNSVREESADEIVGTLGATGPQSVIDSIDSYQIVSVDGVVGNGNFTIDATSTPTLKTTATLDFETQQIHTVRIAAVNTLTGVLFEQDIDIHVLDVGESTTSVTIDSADYTVSHAKTLTFSPASGLNLPTNANLVLAVYDPVSNNYIDATNPDEATLIYGKVKVNSDFTLTYDPESDLKTRTGTDRLMPDKDANGNVYRYSATENIQYVVKDKVTGQVVSSGNTSVLVTNSLPVFKSNAFYSPTIGSNPETTVSVYKSSLNTIDFGQYFLDADDDPIEVLNIRNPSSGAVTPANQTLSVQIKAPTVPTNPTTSRNFYLGHQESDPSTSASFIFWTDLRTGDPSSLDKTSQNYVFYVSDGQNYLTSGGQTTTESVQITSTFNFKTTAPSGTNVAGVNNIEITEIVGVNTNSMTIKEVDGTLHHDLQNTQDVLSSRSSEWKVSANTRNTALAMPSRTEINGVSVDTLTGDFLIAEPLELDLSGGDSELSIPGLIYDSSTVDARPTITGKISRMAGTEVPTSIKAELRWYDHLAEYSSGKEYITTTREYSIPQNYQGEDLIVSIRPDVPPEVTGSYRWQLVITMEFATADNFDDSSRTNLSLMSFGETPIVVNQVRPENSIDLSTPYAPMFGNGWSLAGIPSLQIDPHFDISGTSNSASKDDRLFVVFPGEAPKVFRLKYGNDAPPYTYDLTSTFVPIDVARGTDTTNEWGVLQSVSIDGSVNGVHIEYRDPDGTVYTFARKQTSGKQPTWLLTKIHKPDVKNDVIFTYNETDTSLPFGRLMKISMSDLSVVTFWYNDDTKYGTVNGISVTPANVTPSTSDIKISLDVVSGATEIHEFPYLTPNNGTNPPTYGFRTIKEYSLAEIREKNSFSSSISAIETFDTLRRFNYSEGLLASQEWHNVDTSVNPPVSMLQRVVGFEYLHDVSTPPDAPTGTLSLPTNSITNSRILSSIIIGDTSSTPPQTGIVNNINPGITEGQLSDPDNPGKLVFGRGDLQATITIPTVYESLKSELNGVLSNAIGNSTTTYTYNLTGQKIRQEEDFEQPTYITNVNVPNGTASGVTIGLLKAWSNFNPNSLTFTLENGVGDDDNDSFHIINTNELIIQFNANYATQSEYHIRIKTADTSGGEWEQQFTIFIEEPSAPHDIKTSDRPLSVESWTYDRLGSVSTYTDPLGRVTHYTYDYDIAPATTGTNDPSSPVDNGRYDRNDYRGNVVAITDLTGVTKFVYENLDSMGVAIGLPIMIVDPRGTKTYLSYNSDGQILTSRTVRGTREADNATTTDDLFEQWEYYTSMNAPDPDVVGLLKSYTNPLGLKTTYEYDDSGNRRLTKMTVVDEGIDSGTADDEIRITTFTYDASGYVDLIKLFDADENIATNLISETDYDYDAVGFLRSSKIMGQPATAGQSGPVLQTMSYNYDADGRISKSIDGNGTATVYAYNTLGQLTSMTEASGKTAVTQLRDSIAGSSFTSTVSIEAVTTYEYYLDGTLKSVTLPDGTVQKFYFDPNAFTSWVSTSNVAGIISGLSSATPMSGNFAGNEVVKTQTDVLGRVVLEANLLSGLNTAYEYGDIRHDLPTSISTSLTLAATVDPVSQLINSIQRGGYRQFFRYDAVGNVIYEQSGTQAAVERSYDEIGYLISESVRATYGARTEYTTNPLGQVLLVNEYRKTPTNTVTPEQVFTTQMKYDEQGRLRKVTDPLTGVESDGGTGTLAAATVTYDYEPSLSVVDRNGAPATLYGLLKVESVSRVGEVNTQWFDGAGRLRVSQNSSGMRSVMDYDANGNMLYERDFAITAMAGFPDRLVTYEYDALNRLRASRMHVNAVENNATALTSYIDYFQPDDTATGWDMLVTDPNGNQTASIFDSLGRPVLVVSSPKNTTAGRTEATLYSYADDSTLGLSKVTVIQTIGANQNSGKLVTKDDVYTLDGTNSSRREVRNTVSADGRALIEEVNPVLSGFIVQGRIEYDVNGRVATQIEGGDHPTSYKYDDTKSGTGLPKTITQKKNGIEDLSLTERTYDSAGNLLREETVQKGDVVSFKEFGYDALGRMTGETIRANALDENGDPIADSYISDLRFWTYEGLKTTYHDRNDLTTTVVLDIQNRTRTETFSGKKADGTNVSITSIQTFYPDGKLQQVAQTTKRSSDNVILDQSVDNFTYDEFGRLVTQEVISKFDQVDAPDYLTSTTYHPNGQVHVVTNAFRVHGSAGGYQVVSTTTHELDEMGRLLKTTNVSDPDDPGIDNAADGWWYDGDAAKTKRATFTYDIDGQIDTVTRESDLGTGWLPMGFSDYNYRNDGRLTELFHRVSASPASSKIATYRTLGYDLAGRLINATTKLYSQAGTAVIDEAKVYDYDIVGQLRFVKNTDNTPASGPVDTYTPFKFDANGNPDLGFEDNGSDNRNYSHDANSSGWKSKYDHEGRTIERKKTTRETFYSPPGVTTTFEKTETETLVWDVRGRLTSIIRVLATEGTVTSTSTVSYVYDGLDRRIGRTEVDPDGITTRYAILYDANGEAFEVQLAGDGDGNIVRHDFRVPNRAGLLAVDEAKVAGPTQTAWTFADGAGTVGTLAVADGSGNWQWSHRTFDIHGSVTQVVGDSVASFGEIPTFWRGMEGVPFGDLYQSGTTVYDPTDGRYLSQATGSANPYVYDNNRPTSPDRPLLSGGYSAPSDYNWYSTIGWGADQLWLGVWNAPSNLYRGVRQMILGNWTDDVTLLGTAGQIGLGVTGLDALGDVRDILADVYHIGQDAWNGNYYSSHWAGLGIDVVSLLPLVGVLKYGDEVAMLAKKSDTVADEVAALRRIGANNRTSAAFHNRINQRAETAGRVAEEVAALRRIGANNRTSAAFHNRINARAANQLDAANAAAKIMNRAPNVNGPGVVTGLRNRGAFQGMNLTGVTRSGVNRASAQWRALYGPAAMRRHHLVPQEMTRNRAFIDRMEDLGYTAEQAVSFVNRQIADIPNVQHMQIHAEGWNPIWREWLRRNPNFEVSDIRAQVRSMMGEFELPRSSLGGPQYGR